MKFFDSFWKASFYKEGKATSFWGAFGKVTLVTFIAAILCAICFYVTFGMHIPGYLYSYGVQALNGYPNGLVVSVENDRLSKNIEGELHLYPIPERKIGKMKTEEILPGYVIAINDKENVSFDSYERSNALILLARDGIVARGDGETQIMSYADLLKSHNKVAVTKDMVGEMVSVVNTYAESVPCILFVAIIVLYTLFAPLGYLIFTLFSGLIIMLFSAQIIRRKIAFGEAYIYGMYALAPVIIFEGVLRTIPYIKNVVDFIPFFGTLSILGFLWLMFRSQTKPVQPKVTKEVKEEVVDKPVKKTKTVATKKPTKKTTKEAKTTSNSI